MTTEKGRMANLTTLVERREAVGYTLPLPLLEAHALAKKVAALTIPVPPGYHHDDAAAEVLAAITRNDPVDTVALGQRIRTTIDAGADAGHAQRIIAAAAEKATDAAIAAAHRYADEVIVEHLRPVHTQLLEQAARDAAVLAGHPRDSGSLIVASAKVRQAWAALRDAGIRWRQVREARGHINDAGVRTPEHDTRGQFAIFKDPFALFPNTNRSGAMPRIELPTEPVDLMLWLVAGDATSAHPWMPTTAEQDQAWENQYGDVVRQRQAANASARSVLGATA